MATLVDATACAAPSPVADASLLPADPFTALQFHFGMLLGVDDLETGQGYARGKARLHNAWLHGEGVVWGLAVAWNPRRELAVEPGLALDAAGHELHLDRPACLDPGAWYAAHRDDAGFTFEDAPGGGKRFTVHVVARFRACLTRPVPAMLEPCAGAQTETAFSRAFETVELLLRPGLSRPRDPGYHRLRQLLRLEPDDPALAEVPPRRSQIEALPAAQQPAAWLQALREFAALDTAALRPQAAGDAAAASIFPQDPTELTLADVADIVVAPDAAGGWTLADPLPAPVVTVRRSHVATATIQELLCGPAAVAATAPPAPAPGGPTVSGIRLQAQALLLTTSRALAPGTVAPAAFAVSDFSAATGWTPLPIAGAALQADGSLRVDLGAAPAGTHLRVIAFGTGATPLLAADDLAPLGAPGAGGAADGTDFVTLIART